MEQKRKINNDVFIGAGLTIFAIFFLRETSELHQGAAIFPRLILTTFLILSIVITALGVRKTLNPALEKKDDFAISIPVVKMPVIAFAIIVLYVVLLNIFGFFISTAIFTPLFMIFFGARKITTIVITTVGINLFVWGLFVQVLNVWIP